MYAAQEIPQIDTEIAQKGHFRMETNYQKTKLLYYVDVLLSRNLY